MVYRTCHSHRRKFSLHFWYPIFKTTSIPWAVRFRWLENAYSHTLYSTDIFEPSRYWCAIISYRIIIIFYGATPPVLNGASRNVQLFWACKITSLCVKRLRFVPLTLMNMQRDTKRLTTFWPAYMNSSARWAIKFYNWSEKLKGTICCNVVMYFVYFTFLQVHQQRVLYLLNCPLIYPRVDSDSGKCRLIGTRKWVQCRKHGGLKWQCILSYF